jgi:hypothetical protein
MSDSLVSRNYFFNKILISLGIGFLAITPFGIFYYWNKLKRKNNKKSKNDPNSKTNNFPQQSNKDEKSNLNNIINTQNSKPPLDEIKVNKLLTRICENILNVLAVSCDIIKQDYVVEEKRFKSIGNNMKEFTLEAFKLGCKFLLHIKIF